MSRSWQAAVTADGSTVARYRGGQLACLTAEVLAAERGMTMPQFIASTREGRDVYWQLETERIYGIPYTVNDMLDLCFQVLPPSEAVAFPGAAVEAIAVLADLREPQKTFAGTDACQEHFRWHADRLLHHLSSASVAVSTSNRCHRAGSHRGR